MKKCLPVLMVCFLAVIFSGCKNDHPLTIIPEPAECTQKSGHFTIDDQTFLCFENIAPKDKSLMSLISDSYTETFHLTPNVGDKGSCKKNYILFEINKKNDDKIGPEGYRLTVTKRHVIVTANSAAGLFYGFQTVLQMTYPDETAKRPTITLPCVKIVDYPRFSWRGAHLDVSRHFFDVNYVKRYIDIMAMYKINKFHWHLTDDHGWRIQIDKYPQLTAVGAWRPDRSNVPWDTLHPVLPGEPATYGGFYTKDQIRDIVKYAAARHIDIIPEIEIPGHCSAILAAYPQFACDDYPYTVAVGPYWPPKAIMCAGNDDVLTFYKNVLSEVCELFPYPYIHIGGDEAVNTNWQTCPKCQQRIADKGLADEDALQQWVMNQIDQFLVKKGKKSIIWDDIVSEDMTNKSTIMCWQGVKQAVIAAKHGNDVIMCPTTHCYFNYYQDKPSSEPIAMEGLITLGKAYSFDPMPKGLNESQAKHILGGQCNLWTEFVNTPKQAEYMLLPRLCALSECVWSPADKKNWDNFTNKVAVHQVRLKQLGYNCSDKRVK